MLNFSADFLNFHNFYCNFVKNVAPSSNKNENYVVHLKDQSLLKETVKNGIKIDP